MNRFAWLVFASVVLVPMFSATATDPYPIDPVSEITSRWADAARGVDRLHAKVLRYEYDDVYRTVKRSEGTLDFEQPNRCRYELQPFLPSPQESGNANDLNYTTVAPSAQTIVWSGKGVFFIRPDERLYDFIPIDPDKLAVVEQVHVPSGDNPTDGADWIAEAQSVYAGDTFWEMLVATVRRFSALQSQTRYDFSFYASPGNLLPILLSDPDSVRKQGYELAQLKDFKKGLTARPNSDSPDRGIVRIDILFDAATGLPSATRLVNRHQTIVHVLKNVVLKPDFSRSDLFDPNLEGLTAAFEGRTPTETRK